MKASGANRAGIYFNNDYDAHAPKNATVLRRILKGFGDRSAIPKQGRPSGNRSPLGIGEKPMKTNGGCHAQ